MIDEIRKTVLDSVYEVKILLQIFVIIFFVEAYFLHIYKKSLFELNVDFTFNLNLKMIVCFIFFITLSIFVRGVIRVMILPFFIKSPKSPNAYFDNKSLRALMALGASLIYIAFYDNNFIAANITFGKLDASMDNFIIGGLGVGIIIFSCISEAKQEKNVKFQKRVNMGKNSLAGNVDD